MCVSHRVSKAHNNTGERAAHGQLRCARNLAGDITREEFVEAMRALAFNEFSA